MCAGSQEPIQKTQQCYTAKQRFVNKGVQWLFPVCTVTPGHNHKQAYQKKTEAYHLGDMLLKKTIEIIISGFLTVFFAQFFFFAVTTLILKS